MIKRAKKRGGIRTPRSGNEDNQLLEESYLAGATVYWCVRNLFVWSQLICVVATYIQFLRIYNSRSENLFVLSFLSITRKLYTFNLTNCRKVIVCIWFTKIFASYEYISRNEETDRKYLINHLQLVHVFDLKYKSSLYVSIWDSW